MEILVITGPTATGKSDFAVDVAKKFNGEIISADSRQVYRGLDIGSGKITKEEMQGIPHYMLDILDPEDEYSAFKYRKDAEVIVKDILKRGKLPIIVGGTGFYIESLIYERSNAFVEADKEFRDICEQKDIEELQEMLKNKDQKVYDCIDVMNKRRVIRAIEIINELGYIPKVDRTLRWDTQIIGLTCKRDTLRKRIGVRLEARWDGMKEEVDNLIKKGVDPKWLENIGLEYRHMKRMFIDGVSEEDTRENLLNAIFAYAKRQERWWKEKDIKMFDLYNKKEIIDNIF